MTYKKYELLLALLGCFQDLASLMRCPASLRFNHGSHSFWHGLSITCQFHISLEKLMWISTWNLQIRMTMNGKIKEIQYLDIGI
jgi:hypothetical protein